MTTLETRLADYRAQIERLENAVARKNRQIDELLKRLELGPKSESEERVRIWDEPNHRWWANDKSRTYTRKYAESLIKDLKHLGYEIRPVEKPPEEPEMVRVLDRRSKVWWTGGVYKPGGITSNIAEASLYSREALRGLRLDPELYEFQPVEEPLVPKPVEPKRTRVVVELAKGDQPCKPEGGESVTLYANQDCWVGTVVEIEGEKP